MEWAAMTAPVLEATDESVKRVAECIRDGGVVVAPSDTNLALTLDPWNPEAVRRAYEIKDRPTNKPLTLFVHDPGDWRQYATHDEPDRVDSLVDEFWPGPLNLVLQSTETVDDDTLVDVPLAREHVGDEVDLILWGEAQGTTRASTILDMSGDPAILRQGDIDAPALRSVLGEDAL